MKLKIKATFLAVLTIVFTLLLLVPEKTEAGVIISSGSRGYSNGMYLCYCPKPENTCSCAWNFSDIDD